MGEWKGVRLSPGGPVELYNLSSDLEETTDIAEENPEMTAKITGIIETARTESAIWNLKTGV